MCRGSIRQPDGLIGVLLNHEAEFGDRHDAAMDLSAYNGEAVEAALEKVILNKAEDPDLIEECEQSLQEIRGRKE